MKVDKRLVDAAIDFVRKRFSGAACEGAAAVYTEDGDILVSTSPEVLNDAVAMCHETGAICQAYTLNKRVAASVCVSREEDGSFVILSPCGVCQERLWSWGGDVEVAVPKDDDCTAWKSVPLKEVSPYYWRKPFMKG